MSDDNELIEFPQSTLSAIERTAYMACKVDISEGLDKAARAIEDIRDHRLYREEYPTFEDFCQKELGRSRRYVNRLITAMNVNDILALGAGTQVPQQTAIELNAVIPEQQVEAFLEAKRISETDIPTAADVSAVVQTGIEAGLYKPQRTLRKKKADVVIEKPDDVIEGVEVTEPTLALYVVTTGANAGAWLTAAASPDEARELIAVDQLIPLANLTAAPFELEGLTFVGTPQRIFGGMWKPLPSREYAKPTVDYPSTVPQRAWNQMGHAAPKPGGGTKFKPSVRRDGDYEE